MADDASYGSRTDLVRRRRGGAGSDGGSVRSGAGMYQPGRPMGYLYARGTPYEHKYLSKKLGFCCLFLAPPIIIITLVITLVPVLWAIGNHALHTSQLHVYAANLTDIGNSSFPLSIEGQVKKTGIFPAHLYFREPVEVYWNTPPPNMRELHLGSMTLDYIGVAAGHGRVKQATTFLIRDEEGFGEFARFLVSEPEFTWQLRCGNVHVEAFSFLPTYKNLVFTKDVVFQGINGFSDVKVLDFQLPGDDPRGGITTQVLTQLRNPSPFGIQLGTLNLGLYYRDMFLGEVQANNVNITQGLNSILIAGQLVPHQDNSTELDLLGELFTGYINGEAVPVEARGISTRLANGQTVGWLSTGIQALVVNVPLQTPIPIDPIKGITIDYLSLIYSEQNPYNPTTFSQALRGSIGLPFGFSLDIVSLSNSISIIYQGAHVGDINAGYSNSTTHLDIISAGETTGVIDITLPPSLLVLPNNTQAARQELIAFQNAFTYMEAADFRLMGSAKALTDTPLGRVLLNGIKFGVGSGLRGLAGLRKYPTVINSVDVVGGAPDAISLVVGTTVVNPSNLNLSVGDSIFQLQNEVVLGNVTLPNLNLAIGRVDVNATSFFDPNRAPQGLETLNRFISGQDTQLNISGFADSSAIESLAVTLSGIRLNSTLPGLSTKLVNAANLTVLDTTGITDSVANSVVGLANPFTAGLTINRIVANASSKGIFIANIDHRLEFLANGKALTNSPTIPLSLNLYPPDIFGLLRGLVVQSGQDPRYLDGVVALGGYTYTPTTAANGNTPSRRGLPGGSDEESFVLEEDDELSQMLFGVGSNPGALAEAPHSRSDGSEEDDGFEFAKRAAPYEDHEQLAKRIEHMELTKRDNLYTGFNLPSYVDRAFGVATLNLEIVSDARIGEYDTTLTFSQTEVPLGTDESLNKLLPVLASPIVQKIVDNAVLNIDRVTILNPQPESFQVALQGTITNSGPFDATISFPQGLSIFWQGQLLVQTSFPDVQLKGDTGASLNVMVEARVPSVPYLTDFTKFLLTQPSFVWSIRGEGLSVAALGITVPNIAISKDVQLTGFNGLRGMVIINSFDLPSNDEAGGIHLTAQSTINSPAQVGVQLSTFGTSITRNDTQIGPAAAQNEFTLQALAVTQLPLVGRLIPQNDDTGLAVLSEVFTRFVHNTPSNIVVHGENAGPSNVAWLNDGIKVLAVDVSLPAQAFDVIRVVSINQLSLFFTVQSSWAPPTSSQNTTANFYLPFAFPVDIQNTGGPFIANYNGQDAAVLNIPLASQATTNVEARILTLVFNDVPFEVYDNSHPTFSQFLADTTARDQVTFNLHGAATAKAGTAAGVVTISDIPFNLPTNILGLQNLNARPAVVSNLDVVHGYPTYLLITVNTALYNPSDITIGAGDVRFAVLFQDRPIGMALIKNIVLVPGTNIVPTQINYSPQGAENVRAGQTLLENYVQNITSPTIVAGTQQTTPIESLVQALSGIRLTAEIPPLMKLIVIEARLVVPKDIAQTGVAQASVMIANPFTAGINILRLHALANYFGPSDYGLITLGTIDQDFTSNPLSNPGHQVTTSRQIPINLNIDPKNLIRFIFTAAKNTGTSLGPFPPFLQRVLDLPDTRTTISPYPYDTPPPCNSGRQFDILGAILNLLKGLQTSIPIESTLKLDDYQTDLNFIQQPVPTDTDNTALYLVGPAAAPLIQIIVNEATLFFTQANATNLVNTGFDVSLKGSLLTDAPADAYIEFPDGILVDWMGSQIAMIELPPICSAAGSGTPDLNTQGHLTITNQDRFIDFAEYILKNPSFTWDIHSPSVKVSAVGIAFSNTILQKSISLDVFNGLPGIVITSFDIPGETSNALIIKADANIPSPSALGVQLDTVNFEIFFMGVDVGPIQATGLFLAPKPASGQPGVANTLAHTTGQIQDQTGNTANLNVLGILFSQFLAGNNQTLQLRGVSVVTEANGNQPVSWLTAAFKRFQTNAVLPGQIYQIIFAITLSDLTAKIFGPDPYVIKGSNNQTVAIFANPFRFSLTPIRAGPMITLTYQGVDTAQINLPSAPVQAGTSRGPDDREQLLLNFKDQDVAAIDRPSFQAFFAKLTDTDRADFGLKGTTSVLARTVIGDIPLQNPGIPFNVTTSLAGINSFNHVFTTSDLVVQGGTPQYILIPLKATLENPSQLTVFTDQVSLPIVYRNVYVGRAIIPQLGLIPGTNVITTNFQYMPDNPGNEVAQNLLRSYLQPVEQTESTPQLKIPIEILGTGGGSQPLTPYDSLVPALRGVQADGTIDGIGSRVVTMIDVFLSLPTLLGALNLAANPTVSAKLYTQDQLPAAITFNTLNSVIRSADEPFNSDPYAVLNNTFDPGFTTPGGTINNPGTAISPTIENIRLVKGNGLVGLLASVPLIGHNLNVFNQLSVNIGSDGGGYNAPSFLYDEINVKTRYFICADEAATVCVPLDIGALGKGLGDLLGLIQGILKLGGDFASALLGALGNIPVLGGLLGAAGDQLGGILGLLMGANNGAAAPAVAQALAANGTNLLTQGLGAAAANGAGTLTTLVKGAITAGDAGGTLPAFARTMNSNQLTTVLEQGLNEAQTSALANALKAVGSGLVGLIGGLVSNPVAKALICDIGEPLGLGLLVSAGCTTSAAPSTTAATSTPAAQSLAGDATSAAGGVATTVQSAVNSAAAPVSSAAAPVASAGRSAVSNVLGGVTSVLRREHDL
ncbi:hypothetical protein BDZ90DRAFT_262821 [Jaminaea rosea]|uniref:Pre-rRNA processing protein n=1 Tax=Jaminaea rosea TaxID=1569628 RepID=A0A316UJC7_9BASI|nr:hypothetical protein BDZ90DRAFT_262821 [Jaminaea rosea]PWN24968.1 hypothetical protein BDZ90DRAFT_262821 [Jaminaea rosea]